MNAGISIAAFFVAAVQMIFLFNLFWSRTRGKPPAVTHGKHHSGMADTADAAGAR